MIRLRLLGGIDLRDGSGSALQAVLVQPRRLALLAYLALAERDTPRRRDTILAAFWPELDEERARARLNKAVFFLRRALGPEAIVTRGAEDVAVDHSIVWCDVIGFREALRAADLGAAMALWRGDLLPGFHVDDAQPFEEWLERERATLRMEAGDAARKVARLREREGDLTGALSAARQAVELTVEDERALRDLIELLDRLGDRAGALSAYGRFAAYLAREFDAAPAAQTKQLIARVRASDSASDSASVGRAPSGLEGEGTDRNHPLPGAAPAPTSPPSVPQVLRPMRRPRWARQAAMVSVGGVAALAAWNLAPRAPAIDPNVIVVAPFVGTVSGSALDSAGLEVADHLTAALTLAGISGVVPSTRVHELASANRRADRGIRRRVARATGAGILVSGTIGGQEGRVELRTEVLRMPAGRAVVVLEPVEGRTVEAALDSLRERLVVAVLAHRDHGDDFGWGRDHRLPRSMAAYQASLLADGSASLEEEGKHWEVALAQDPDWPRALIERSRFVDSLIAVVERRLHTFADGDRDLAQATLAFLRQDWEGAYKAYARRLAVDSVWWSAAAAIAAYRTERFEETVRLERLRDVPNYWSHPRHLWLWRWEQEGYALHALGRFDEELELARDYRARFPQNHFALATMEVQAYAGLGRGADVERVVQDAMGLAPSVGDETASQSRAAIAAIELRAHGDPEVGRRVAELAVPWFKQRAARGELTPLEREGYLEVLWPAERWDELATEARVQVADAAAPRVLRLSALGLQVLAEWKLGDTERASASLRRMRQLVVSDDAKGNGHFLLARTLFAVGDLLGGMDAFREAYRRGEWMARSAHVRHRMLLEACDYPPFRALVAPR